MSNLLSQYEFQLDPVLDRAETLAGAGPAWLQELRREGLRTFREHGVPTPKVEEWKYTPLRDFAETAWAVSGRAPKAGPSGSIGYEAKAIKILLEDGHYQGTEGDVPGGLTVCSMKEAISNRSELIQGRLGCATGQTTQATGREIRPDIYPFGALNTAAFEDGVLVHLAKDANVPELIEIVHVCGRAGNAANPIVSLPRILIVAEAGSRAKIVETYVSEKSSRDAVIGVTEVYIGEGAVVEHVRVQDQSETSTNISLWQTQQAKDSTYTAFNVVYGGRLARLDQGIWIGGEGCTTRLDGVVCANGDQHMDNHTRLDHAVANCNSFEIYKQIVDDKATVVFNGKIFVHQDAQKTDAKQTNQALLLAPTATIDSKPQLEIFADDVKCTHGATVGQLEDLPMFYMRSRGVTRDEAQAVLVYAFAAEVLELISISSVRESLEKKLYLKLGVDLS